MNKMNKNLVEAYSNAIAERFQVMVQDGGVYLLQGVLLRERNVENIEKRDESRIYRITTTTCNTLVREGIRKVGGRERTREGRTVPGGPMAATTCTFLRVFQFSSLPLS